MLLLFEIKRHILRAPARTIITACVAALLVCGMAFYLRNIQVTQEALDELSARVPVKVRVITPDGSSDTNLQIEAGVFDALTSQDVRDVLCTSRFSFTMWSVDGKESFDPLRVHAANAIAALNGPEPEGFTYLDGWDESFLLADEPVCAVESSFAREHGIELGSSILASVYTISREEKPMEYAEVLTEVAIPRITVVALFESGRAQMQGGWNACAPIDWLRRVTESAVDSDGEPVKFYYDSASAYLAKPRELNQFKAAMNEYGVYEKSPIRRKDSERLIGDTISVDDEMYIKASGEIVESLAIYETFKLPFFGVIVTIVALITFLSLRSCRLDIAIASSLGRQKLLNAAAPFFSTVILQALGCTLALAVMCLATGLAPSLAGTIMGAFTLCAAVGTALALTFLFRFDTLTLLTKND